MRALQHKNYTNAPAMFGFIYRLDDDIPNVQEVLIVFDEDMRRSAVYDSGDELDVYWTRVGEPPERIYVSHINLKIA